MPGRPLKSPDERGSGLDQQCLLQPAGQLPVGHEGSKVYDHSSHSVCRGSTRNQAAVPHRFAAAAATQGTNFCAFIYTFHVYPFLPKWPALFTQTQKARRSMAYPIACMRKMLTELTHTAACTMHRSVLLCSSSMHAAQHASAVHMAPTHAHNAYRSCSFPADSIAECCLSPP